MLTNIGVNMSDKETTAITEQQIHQNPLLSMVVEEDSPLKEYLVEFVGTKYETEEVTVEMITEAMAIEFPEFMYAVAEENFLIGYKKGLDDAETIYNRTPTEDEE
jgi:hypothetical protein